MQPPVCPKKLGRDPLRRWDGLDGYVVGYLSKYILLEVPRECVCVCVFVCVCLCAGEGTGTILHNNIEKTKVKYTTLEHGHITKKFEYYLDHASQMQRPMS